LVGARMKTKILVVPQTPTNLRLLRAYVAQLSIGDFEVLFLRNRLWGSRVDPFSAENEPASGVLEPDFLMKELGVEREWERAKLLRRLEPQLDKLLLSLEPAVVVCGVDSTGMGRWVTLRANKLRIPTVVVQEGCRELYKVHESMVLRTKKMFYEYFGNWLLSPAGYAREYATAQYVATWGEYDKKIAIRHGARPKRVFVVGRPDMAPRSATGDGTEESKANHTTVLFLDAPILCWSPGSADYEGFQKFRVECVRELRDAGYQVLYKLHPLTIEREETGVRAAVSSYCTVVKEGLAEDYMESVAAVLSFPSTAVYTVVRRKIPLVLLWPRTRGFRKILWNPVTRYGAGVLVRYPGELREAMAKATDNEWQLGYKASSGLAAADMLRPNAEAAGASILPLLQVVLSLDRERFGFARQ
jgi:hypothetical protein